MSPNKSLFMNSTSFHSKLTKIIKLQVNNEAMIIKNNKSFLFIRGA